MARLTLVSSATKGNINLAAHRASATEGEAVRRLLESQGYVIRKVQNQQIESRCPFHEGPGAVEARAGTKFYIHASSGVYFCQSASCMERGNLKTLERHFGIDLGEDEYVSAFRSREEKLKEFELLLPGPESR